MHIPKKYFHDRMVLVLLSVNTFFALVGSVLVLLGLDSGQSGNYLAEYRSNLGLGAYKYGSSSALIGFILFAMAILFLNTLLSIRIYLIRRQYAVATLAMGSLLLIVSLIVSNSLLASS